MTVDEIRELIKLASETGIAELEVQRGENRVRIRRAAFASPQEIVLAPQAYPAAVAMPSGTVPATPAAAAATAPALEPAAEKAEKPPDPNLVLVKSPIVGTFY